MGKSNPKVGPITATTVKKLVHGPERYTLWDGDHDKAVKGFGVRIAAAPSRTKTFVFRYRPGGGRKAPLRLFVIGRYGSMTPEQARAEAEKAEAKARLGQDPQAERAETRAELTVSELCDRYMKEGVAHKKDSTLAIDKVRIARHIKPALGRKRLSEVKQGDVQRLLADIAEGRLADTPHARGGKAAASRTVGLLSGIFAFAVNQRLMASNPAKAIKRPKDNKRKRYLSGPELARLGAVLAEREASGPPHVASVIRLLLLTGCRKNEIVRLKWSEVDLGNGLLRLEDSKTGAKDVRLGSAAAALLAGLERGNSLFVFPHPDDMSGPIRNIDWAWVRVRGAAGIPDVRLHDLRHSFASVGMNSGFGLAILRDLLTHSDISTTQRYAHIADDPLQAAADQISASIEAAMSGAEAEVLQFRKGGR